MPFIMSALTSAILMKIHPAMHTIKLAIFLAAFTTLIGFGVLVFASHALLRSIGIVSFLGIGYSLIGAYFILPVLMEKIFAPFQYPTGEFAVRLPRAPAPDDFALPSSARLSTDFCPV